MSQAPVPPRYPPRQQQPQQPQQQQPVPAFPQPGQEDYLVNVPGQPQAAQPIS